MHKVLIGLSFCLSFALLGCSASETASTAGAYPSNKGSGAPSNPLAPKAGGAGAITPDNTKIEFVGTKPEGKHDGGFKKFSGNLKPADGDVTKASLSVEIDTDSLFSDDPKLTAHLKTQDFFDVKKYPDAKFVSKEIKAEKKDENTHIITGDLTLHGTTKAITIPAKITTSDDSVTLESTFKIDRTEFGITFDPTKVDKDVTIKVSAKIARK